MDPRYPIGKYTPPQEATPALRQQAISAIAEAPAKLRAAVKGLNDEQLNTPYREGGWTVRQVAHHVPDSHMNAYVRFRLALTEQEPTIKPYEEARWAELNWWMPSQRRWMFRWRCWIRCTTAGCACCIR